MLMGSFEENFQHLIGAHFDFPCFPLSKQDVDIISVPFIVSVVNPKIAENFVLSIHDPDFTVSDDEMSKVIGNCSFCVSEAAAVGEGEDEAFLI